MEKIPRFQTTYDWNNPATRRWSLFAVSVGLLFVMAFYALTDATHLAHDHALTGSDWLGAGICHRITDRSFMINGRQFPLCARCTGMYLGVILVFIVLGLAGRLRWGELPRTPVMAALIGFIGLMGVDGINSYTHFFPGFPHVYEPRNWLRLVTGVGTGLAMGAFAFPALAQTLWQYRPSPPVIGSWRELAALLAVAATAVLLLLSNLPAINYVLAIGSTAGLVIILAAINAVLLLTLLRRDGLATRWQETAVPLAASLLLALGELLALAYLRVSFLGTITGFPGL